MEKSVYNCSYKGVRKLQGVDIDLYSFKCEFNHTYIVEVEKHRNDIYLIQFYLKSHTDSDDKFSLLIPSNSKKKKKGTKNFLIILNTLQDLIFSYLSRNPKASFGFIGARTLNFNKTRKALRTKELEVENADGTFENTQRFRIYTSYLKRSFSTEYFSHIEVKSISAYLLLNKKSDLTPNDGFNFFLEYISL